MFLLAVAAPAAASPGGDDANYNYYDTDVDVQSDFRCVCPFVDKRRNAKSVEGKQCGDTDQNALRMVTTGRVIFAGWSVPRRRTSVTWTKSVASCSRRT